MKRTLSFLLPAAAMLLAACGGANDRPSFPDFQEMADPAAAFADWSAAGDTPCASFVTTDRRFGKSQLPDVEPRTACRLTAWRGERVSAQLLVWSAQLVERLVCTAGVLTSDEGRLPESAVRTRFVRYVMSDEFACGCCKRKPQDFAAVLTADMLDERPSMALEACTVRPVWITVDVPQDAAPGLYRTPVTVACDGDEQRLELAVEVTGRTLPAPSEWRYHLDLWQHPAAVARVEGTEMWSDAHFEALRPVMKPLADAGQKVVTATLNKDPWNNQCYDAYADMIVWTKGCRRRVDIRLCGLRPLGGVHGGAGRRQTDQLLLDAAVEQHAALPRRRDGRVGGREGRTGPARLRRDVAAVPRRFRAASGRKGGGWRRPASPWTSGRPNRWRSPWPSSRNTLRSWASRWPTTTTATSVTRSCTTSASRRGREVAPEDIAARRRRRAGDDLLRLLLAPLSQHVHLLRSGRGDRGGVVRAANGYDGFLRWAYNSWTEDPLRDSRFRTWPAGGTYVVYPGGRSSIRFERLREGIQDAENPYPARRTGPRELGRVRRKKRARLEAVIAPFASREPAADLHERLAEAKRVLNEL